MKAQEWAKLTLKIGLWSDMEVLDLQERVRGVGQSWTLSHEGRTRSGLGQDGRGLWSLGSTCYVPMDLPPLSCVSVLDNDQPTK